MFKISSKPQFTHPVEVLVPVDGGHEKQTFKATFAVLPADENEDAKYDLNTNTGSTAFLREAVIWIGDLTDGEDKPVEYSDRVRDQLLKVPYIRAALARTYFAAITKAAVGN